jgi:hypothetical protein
MKVVMRDLITIATKYGYACPTLSDSMTAVVQSGLSVPFTKTIGDGSGSCVYTVQVKDSAGYVVSSLTVSGSASGNPATVPLTITFPAHGSYTVEDIAGDSAGEWGFFEQSLTV